MEIKLNNTYALCTVTTAGSSNVWSIDSRDKIIVDGNETQFTTWKDQEYLVLGYLYSDSKTYRFVRCNRSKTRLELSEPKKLPTTLNKVKLEVFLLKLSTRSSTVPTILYHYSSDKYVAVRKGKLELVKDMKEAGEVIIV